MMVIAFTHSDGDATFRFSSKISSETTSYTLYRSFCWIVDDERANERERKTENSKRRKETFYETTPIESNVSGRELETERTKEGKRRIKVNREKERQGDEHH
jgi:hypothetical protein